MKNILLTGASSAIGQALLKYWGSDKNNNILITSYKSNINLNKSIYARVKYLKDIDLTNIDDLKRLSESTKNFFTEEFSLVHSVGDFWYHVPFQETDVEVALRYISSHYLTLYGTIQSLIPLMVELGGGRILAFTCNSVGYNYPHMAPFTCAKAAIECLIKCISNEFNGKNIVANAISLPSINTPQVVNSKPNGDHNAFIKLEELVNCVDNILNSSSLINGNVTKLVKYSYSFYNQGYFERNKANKEN